MLTMWDRKDVAKYLPLEPYYTLSSREARPERGISSYS